MVVEEVVVLRGNDSPTNDHDVRSAKFGQTLDQVRDQSLVIIIIIIIIIIFYYYYLPCDRQRVS